MSSVLPYGRQSITESDISSVCDVLRSDFLTGGPKVEEFEQRFCELVGARHAVAVNSATSALHLALRVANVGPGNRVVTSPNTFLASANCAAFVGAIPDFSDIDPVSFNLAATALESGWREDTKAVVAVDYAGQPCDMPGIAHIARERGAIVIEDASHAAGGGFSHGRKMWKIGGHPWADITVFSFHPVKTMTTGEGGMLVTANKAWADKARRLRSHGIVRNCDEFCVSDENSVTSEKGPWYYEMQELGYNYRITDFQCALGLSQLQRLDQFISRRLQIVARYNEAFAEIPWLKTPGLQDSANRDLISWHLYTLQIDFQALGRTRTEVMVELRRKGVATQVLYIPVHLQPWYRTTYSYAAGKCPVAENYYRQALSLPLYPALQDTDTQQVIDAVCSLHA